MDPIFEKIEKAIDIEIESILHFRKNLDPSIKQAIELILDCKGKLIVTGVGKSGDVGKKISSTLSSTGTPSVFLHPADAAHGDAGIISGEDIIVAIGKSGESEELLNLIPTIKNIGAKLISMTANVDSKLAQESDVVLITPVLKEACPLELAPTSSTTIALILGDAIAMCLMELKNFKRENFALYHPAGRLGKRLSLKIDDVMRKDKDLAKVLPDTKLENILTEITVKRQGATGVTDSSGILLGIITDFDIRKKLKEGKLDSSISAEQLMNSNPTLFLSGSNAYDVLKQMESRPNPISVAPIVDNSKRLIGIVSIHDLLQKGL
ncbi:MULTISPECIES: KpsF/GutQ family sugar-phosphate isomerase [Leptospira]|uniref:KpsF/GutQ family sugar-phosphate isomerase n=1 Tax=Leptospira kirschneri serovar Pomona TaxID=561005 RepID=A0A1T1DGQ0_9LEPT|nr:MULTISPECIES: KpsF/GutQ family sugar-phosphate isomerase [Leptospira]EMJ85900.1 sugar isomerase, KpsF/GutQ family [Leptospira kirschneri str. JB]EMK10920.1 sugar isomerase, KpsF/GutQ family [Leptospira kirschneri]KXZ28489.1 polyhydroxyalkanoate biosynthesis repressor PhaR [Leptospira kirschneri]KXZ31259.1 polyhydroxyalkanoate biosynthesis repressor PhaR [Leptospira sp. ZV016]OOV40028.1 KpsF/GutQ family sugar-phosphate isomerase [Leptospira kirschneri serovar Pomona]